ncbi:ABC transporter ATP binding and permease protein [Lactococcus cremoris subsp. cremoris MG1363]|uniref:ABC transporter ATP binding and permease protein n=4 Tax=Lactococcus lactis subsp. cremoris TaxID=1359 RepID=A2RJX6_LACLM|nr:ABC transporter ATP binding and permease protein [Lactococcus cremoris subsp. cremoris MG1363]
MLQCSGNIILSKIREGKMVKYLKEFKFENFMVFLLITIDIALAVLSSVFLANVLNSLIAREMNQFFLWLAIDIVLWVVDSFVQGARDVWKEIAIQKQLNAVRRDIIEPLTEISYSDFEKNSKEDYNSWLNNDTKLLYDNGFHQIYFVYTGIVAMLFSGIAIIFFHWVLLLTTLLVGAILFYFPKIFKKSVERDTEQVSDVANDALATSTDYLRGYEVLYHNKQLGLMQERTMGKFNQLATANVKLIFTRAWMQYSLLGASMLGQFLILAVAGFLIMNGQIGIGVVMSVGNLSGTVTNYSKSVANSLILLNATGKLLEKYGKIADESKVTDGEEVTDFESKLELKNLSVAFPDGQKIEYPEIVIEKGKKYAIIGDSGSGKSTLINLLVGNKRDYEGEILLDGKDYKGINRKSLPHVMSVIMQFPYLFRETVEENLTLGRKISPDIFDKSIRIACADDFVFNKLDTIYDKNLSGGQQERLSVARELMGTKPILVMDESTASVDKKTALAVEKNILENPDLTVIMITHHLYDETQNYLDEVIHLDTVNNYV